MSRVLVAAGRNSKDAAEGRELRFDTSPPPCINPGRFQFKVAPARQCRTPGQLMLYFRFPAASFCCGQECLSLRINNLLGYTPANLCFKSGQLML